VLDGDWKSEKYHHPLPNTKTWKRSTKTSRVCWHCRGHWSSAADGADKPEKFYHTVTVSDRKGLDQLACQEVWKKCKEEEK
jgi:hypothetical protein